MCQKCLNIISNILNAALVKVWPYISGAVSIVAGVDAFKVSGGVSVIGAVSGTGVVTAGFTGGTTTAGDGNALPGT